MRISDWSSDVCSSDLEPLARHIRTDIGLILVVGGEDLDLALAGLGVILGGHLRRQHRAGALEIGIDARLKIGRASCRERVCQYVSISVVAVSLKKKEK